MRFSVYIVCPLVLSLRNLKLHKTQAVKLKNFAQQKLIAGFEQPGPGLHPVYYDD